MWVSLKDARRVYLGASEKIYESGRGLMRIVAGPTILAKSDNNLAYSELTAANCPLLHID